MFISYVAAAFYALLARETASSHAGMDDVLPHSYLPPTRGGSRARAVRFVTTFKKRLIDARALLVKRRTRTRAKRQNKKRRSELHIRGPPLLDFT